MLSTKECGSEYTFTANYLTLSGSVKGCVWLVTLIASREPSPFRLIWGLKLPESALCVRMLLSVLSREKMWQWLACKTSIEAIYLHHQNCTHLHTKISAAILEHSFTHMQYWISIENQLASKISLFQLTEWWRKLLLLLNEIIFFLPQPFYPSKEKGHTNQHSERVTSYCPRDLIR